MDPEEFKQQNDLDKDGVGFLNIMLLAVVFIALCALLSVGVAYGIH